MSDASSPPAPPTTSIPVEAYYESPRKSFLVTDREGNWMLVDREAVKHRLAIQGIRGKALRGELISPGDQMVVRIQNDNHVQYAGGLAGFKRGIHVVNQAKVLVTSSPCLPEAKEGDWSVLRQLIDQQLAPHAPHNVDQTSYFHTWVQLCDTQLQACFESELVTYGQVLILVGPKGCGKSLLQKIITQVLGGRSASPFKFMNGRTEFNHELFQSEHLCIMDEQPHKDFKNRVLFGDAIKQIAANFDHPYYGKNKDGRTLTPFWRLSVSANDEQDHLEVLPPLADIDDKVVLLHCKKDAMPMAAGTAAEKAVFWARLMRDLPAYLWWLRNEFKMPQALWGERYGLTSFVHPHVVMLLDDLLPERRLITLIDHIIFMDRVEAWRGTAEELSKQLIDNPNYGSQARGLVSNSGWCGRLLSKLADRKPPRVFEERTSEHRYWRLEPPATPLAPMSPPPIVNAFADLIA